MASASNMDAQQLPQQSLSLLRTTSSTSTDSPQEPAHQPVTQTSTRRAAAQSQDGVQERMSEEVTAFIFDNRRCITLFTLCFLVLLITLIVLFCSAFMAAVFHHSKPCDQPLKWYLVISFCWGVGTSRLTEAVARRCDIHDRDAKKWLLRLAFTLPVWGLLGWGVYMIRQSRTCQTTNPSLFYPTEHYIIGQVFTVFFMFAVGIMAALGGRRFLLIISSLIVKPGCQAAVHNLPQVEPGSNELVDEEDGGIKACSVCLEDLSEQGNLKRTNSSLQVGGVKTSAIVRTPCSHYFHEDCLATWCKNHLDCPLCREPVGDPDLSGEPNANAGRANDGQTAEP